MKFQVCYVARRLQKDLLQYLRVCFLLMEAVNKKHSSHMGAQKTGSVLCVDRE